MLFLLSPALKSDVGGGDLGINFKMCFTNKVDGINCAEGVEAARRWGETADAGFSMIGCGAVWWSARAWLMLNHC